MKKRDYKWTTEKKEAWISVSIVTVFFLASLVLIGFMSYLIVSSESLRLENSVERAFNDVTWALQQGEESIPETMQNRDVLGFGYYTPAGNPIYLWGDAYMRLPFSLFDDNSSLSDTLISINRDSGRIECMRYAELISFNPDNLLSGKGNDMLDFPDVIYLAFDASAFIERITFTRAVSVIVVLVIIACYFIVLWVLGKNRQYRNALRQQESLVSLPLSAIRLELAILKRSVTGPVLDDVLVIDHETERLTKLTDRVSEFLHNPLGHPEVVDLVEALRELVPLFHGDVKWLEPKFRIAPVYFDKEKLRSVLENLMKNAIESCEGMEKTDVETEVIADKEGFYHVYVRDRGCGVSKKDEKRIFDPFFTTKVHGSGIGLSITSKFVTAAGGSIRLYLRQGGGTVADVRIPVYGRKDVR